MDLDKLLEIVRQVDLYGILNVEKKIVTEDNDEAVAVAFWRLKGAFKNDKESKIIMFIDPDGPDGELYFIVPALEECEPGGLALTIYMDANMRTAHGAFRWKAGQKGDVVFSYALPIPSGVDNFPDVTLMQRLIKDMYEGLLFREVKDLEMRITSDDLLSDNEKKEKFNKIDQMYKKLLNARNTDDGSV